MSSCTKCAYPSESMARKIAQRRMKEDRYLILRAYRCPACGLFHLTSKEDRFRPDRGRASR